MWSGGLVWLSRWGIHGSVAIGVVVPMLIAGVGGSLCYFAVSVLLTSEIEHEYSGLGSGLFNAGRQIGASIGLAALAVVAASHTRALSAPAASRRSRRPPPATASPCWSPHA